MKVITHGVRGSAERTYAPSRILFADPAAWRGSPCASCRTGAAFMSKIQGSSRPNLPIFSMAIS
jgi:hypothetical protein